MVYVRYSSELGVVLSSRLVAFPGTFRAEPEAIPGLEAAWATYQRTAFIRSPFILCSLSGLNRVASTGWGCYNTSFTATGGTKVCPTLRWPTRS